MIELFLNELKNCCFVLNEHSLHCFIILLNVYFYATANQYFDDGSNDIGGNNNDIFDCNSCLLFYVLWTQSWCVSAILVCVPNVI